jgi:CHAT domain-containing protein/Tfp pilus assembly protein PilF
MKIFWSVLVFLIGSSPLYAVELYKNLYQQARDAELAGQISQALSLYQQAVEQSRQTAPKDAAAILYSQASLFKEQHQFSKAKQAFEESLQLREQHLGKEHGSVAISLNGLASIYMVVADYKKAEELYKEALSITEKQPDNQRNLAIAINNLAELYRTMGHFTEAEPLFKKALELDKTSFGTEHPRVAIRFNNLAELYRQMGDYAKAIQLLEMALDIEKKAEKEISPENMGIRYNNLGQVYRTIGDFEQAEQYYQQALDIFEKNSGKNGVLYAIGLNNMGWIYQALGKPKEAEQNFKKALNIQEKLYGKEHPDIAINLNNLALLLTQQKRFNEALPLYQRALEIFKKKLGKEHPQIAAVLHNQAKLFRAQGNCKKAEELLQEALIIIQTAMQPEFLWAIQDNLSQTLACQGQMEAAILTGKQAVNTLQSLRVNLAQLNKELQQLFVNDKAMVYKGVAALLLEQGRTAEAQQVETMLKEEEYYDFVRRDFQDNENKYRTLKVSFNNFEKPFVEKTTQLFSKLNNVGQKIKDLRLASDNSEQSAQLHKEMLEQKKPLENLFQDMKNVAEEQVVQKILNKNNDQQLVILAKEFQELKQRSNLSPAENNRKSQLRELLSQARRDFNACIGEYKSKELFEEYNLDTLQALQSTLQVMGNGAVLIHYLILPEKLQIILTTPTIQICRESRVSERDLEKHIEQFRTFFNHSPDPRRIRFATQNLQKEGKTLYDWLFQPIAEELKQTEAKTLMLSLDGKLRYLPISALFDGEKYLAERFGFAIYNEAARDKLKDQPKSDWKLAGLGVTKALRNFNPLPEVEKELHSIIKEAPAEQDGVLNGTIKLNEQFNQQSLLSALEQGFPVLHIASHFVFQPRTDQDAYLLLGNADILTLAQIRNDYDFNSLDLLTLSACQTAVGSGGKGKEVEGFGALAQKQGAKSVIATLWPVDDRSTGLFMKRFYQIKTQHHLTKSQALQQTQQAFIQAATQNYPIDFAHPYYWAPFILMGNWL